MIGHKKRPGKALSGAHGGNGVNRSADNIPPSNRIVKRSFMSAKEYDRLSALPFSEMSREESAALCGEFRRRNAGIRFRYDPREFEGRHYWERGFLSSVIAGAKIPYGITPDSFKIPRNKIIFQTLRELEKLNLAGIGLLTVFLRETGCLEAAGGENYLSAIENMIGVPSAVRSFALGLLRLNLGAKI